MMTGRSALVAVATMFACTVGLAADARATPALSAVRYPAAVFVIAAGSSAVVPADAIGGDVQCYSARDGRAFVQHEGSAPAAVGSIVWTPRKTGFVAAMFVRSAHTFVNVARHHSVVCAAWSGR